MTDAETTEQPDTSRLTKRDLVEGKAEKAVTDRMSGVPIAAKGGVDYGSLKDMVDAAKLLSAAGPMIPPWLQGNVGGMFGICMKAQELGISPLSLANWSYVVEQWTPNGKVERVAYESQFFHAVIEQNAPIVGRLNVSYEGAGDARKCRVWATFKGEAEPRYFPPLDADPDQFTLGKLRPGLNDKGRRKGSPLWDLKPDLQLFYNMSRDWARMYAPDIIAGMYGREELEEVGFVAVSEQAKDISPRLAHRLSIAKTDEGFIGEQSIQGIDAALNAAKAPEPVKKKDSEAGEKNEAGLS